eukprot:CAMPEP_0194526382 /NCGR_PEP_ID=MMETSP0253-20130528/62169_1 /TAXON_ID=2966 /ORGANISM="Noctiluca scintillans" /LENGTH=343 /DNA_ID=CAMNT_0039371207 /DNA_START=48 /DNA_END=1075 /DNA_ORIENTATION=+
MNQYSWTLKVDLDGDFRRLSPWLPDGEPSFANVLEAMARLFSLTTHDVIATLILKYRDDEGDLCTLNEATLRDALDLSVPARMLRLVAARRSTSTEHKAPIESVQEPRGAPATPWSMLHSGLPIFAHILPHLCGTPTVDSLVAVLLHFAPLLVQHAAQWTGELDRLASEKAEVSLFVLAALREGLEPFPQFSVACEEMDRLLAASCTQGLGASVESLIRALVDLRPEDQRDIAPLAFGDAMGLLLQIMPLSSMQNGRPAGLTVCCDGCGADVVGSRFKCSQCADYDLCSSCYIKKDQLHPAHAFDLLQVGSAGPGHCGEGFGKGKWGKGMGKGKRGKGKWRKG